MSAATIETWDLFCHREMLRVQSGTKVEQGFTEYEEDIQFDEDDPDFDHHETVQSINVPFIIRVPATMSLTSVHPVDLHSSHSSLTTLSHSLDDISSWSSQVEQAMTIEQLRDQLTSCFTCGVSWSDYHVSLDCSECGGYAMERQCPTCDGNCGAVWKRDLSMSHSSGKARWQGECHTYTPTNTNKENTTSLIAQELCTRLEKLSANS